LKEDRRQEDGRWKMEAEELEVRKEERTIVDPVFGKRTPNL
jgi:hypothetical protein